jgi:hypothetical protein
MVTNAPSGFHVDQPVPVFTPPARYWDRKRNGAVARTVAAPPGLSIIPSWKVAGKIAGAGGNDAADAPAGGVMLDAVATKTAARNRRRIRTPA